MKKLKTEKSSENERMLRQVQNHEYLKRDQQVGEMGAPTTSGRQANCVRKRRVVVNLPCDQSTMPFTVRPSVYAGTRPPRFLNLSTLRRTW